MPELVKKDGTWNDVRVGDLIDGTSVKMIDKKQKFAFVTLDLADQVRPWRKALADPITFEREQLTAEEQVDNRRAFGRELVLDELTKLRDNSPVKMLEQIVVKARQTDGDLAYNVLNWSNLPNVLETQALRKVAIRISNFVDADSLDDATYDQLVDAFARWYAIEFANTLIMPVNPLSRSTSTIANLLEDLDEWANRAIVQKLWFAAIRDDVLARVTELKRR